MGCHWPGSDAGEEDRVLVYKRTNHGSGSQLKTGTLFVLLGSLERLMNDGDGQLDLLGRFDFWFQDQCELVKKEHMNIHERLLGVGGP
ncbi:hypothetical protein E4U30_003685 [Claviceps sp. LM220 group G6]|nr:hypothetical protein E4U30_003685 [Claviceps sp. LM220 group G6]